MNFQLFIESKLMEKGLAMIWVFILLNSLVACEMTQATLTPIATYQQGTVSPTNTLTSKTSLPALTQPAENSNECWIVKNVGHRSLAGSLLYTYTVMDSTTGAPTSGAPAAFNLKTGYSKGLNKFFPAYISPSGKMLAEPTLKDWEIVTAKQSFSYPIPDVTPQKDSSFMFLPNGKILWEGPSSNENRIPGNGVSRDMYIFSPDTGKITFMRSVLLPYSLWKSSTFHDDYRIGLFSPDLRYVLYPANYQNTNMSILLDIQNQKITWYGWPGSDLGFYRPPLPYYMVETPVWRPDSSGIIFHRIDEKTGVHNFYNISVDGQISQLTHLEEQLLTNKYAISSLSISPDGQHLAFAAVQNSQNFPNRSSSLLILDLADGKIINPCIKLANSPSYPAPPIWSPDSSAIIVFPDAGQSVVAIDLKEKMIFDVFPTTGLSGNSLLGWIDWELP